MEIRLSKGCYSENIHAGDQWMDEENEKTAILALELCKKIIERDPIHALKSLIEIYGNHEYDDEACEQCGNTGCDIRLEI